MRWRKCVQPACQRLALARLLFDGGDRHVTAESLKHSADAAGTKVSLATVYNTLNQFTAAGLLREVVVDSEKSYFDTNIGEHHHFYREDTGDLVDIPSEAITLGDLPSAPQGLEISQVDVVIRLKTKS